ncbi:hypothetical protein [Rubrivirga marina]|uniref:Uncharacterized protein n=1 Tax=Rubrivirga marina TaxID=1196024 RepID=A0A271J6I7_9BACT|nr:hypothetical protein [Rubrivirga marina]PAP78565.1 hypothetical protein BSZ37_20110 [Rubrivirga marina]
MRPSLLLALVLAVSACGPDASSDGARVAPSDPDASLPDTAMVRAVSPESTLDLVSGDLLAVSPSVAIQTIDLWIARLDTVSADGATELRDDLTTLRNQLQSSPLDGPGIGRTLRDVGEQTGALAEAGTPLAALGDVLRRSGQRLAPDTTAADSAGADG